MNQGKYWTAGFGTTGAAVSAGGSFLPTLSLGMTCTEEYNGTSWNSGTSVPTSVRGAGTGNSSYSGFIVTDAGGSTSPGLYCGCTFEYNGSSWSQTNQLNIPRAYSGLGGSQNSGFAVGGYGSPANNPGCRTSDAGDCTEEYNGTSWSNSGALPTQRRGMVATGTVNSGLASQGEGFPSPSLDYVTYLYNGSSWSTGPNSALPGSSFGAGIGSNRDSTIIAGGEGTSGRCAQTYNGVSWSTGPQLNNYPTLRIRRPGGAGTNSNGMLLFGGCGDPSPSGGPWNGLTCTEEFHC
tara:strand:+ start:235 stop:1113 length:879 start_codon:yes stop_codon:yes gene_type:complete